MSDIYLKLHSGPQPAADWTTQNPNLAQFEMGVESDTGLFKINWSSAPTAWADLSYANSGSVSDTAYDATSWNGVTAVAPSKNAVRDKFEALSVPVKATGAEIDTGTDDAKFVTAKALTDSAIPMSSEVSDTAYDATSWDAVTTIAPSKNAIRDKIEAILTSIAALVGGNAAASIGYLESPINPQSGDYTGVLSDSGKTILMTGASKTFTIPANASVAYPVGTCISGIFTNASGGSVAITSDTMTLANSTTTGTRTVAQNGRWTAQKMTSTTWIIAGVGLT